MYHVLMVDKNPMPMWPTMKPSSLVQPLGRVIYSSWCTTVPGILAPNSARYGNHVFVIRGFKTPNLTDPIKRKSIHIAHNISKNQERYVQL